MGLAGIAFFVVAVYALYTKLSRHSFSEIHGAMAAIPNLNLLLALMAAALSYSVLASYDWLALRYIGKKLTAWKWMLAGFMGFSITNNAGTAIVSGAAMRYRLYTMWKVQLPDIFKMIIFSGFTYLTGCFFLLTVAYFLVPEYIRSEGIVAFIFWPSLIALVSYFLVTTFYKGRRVNVGEDYSVEIPSNRIVVMQGVLGMLDTFTASLVMYALLSPLVQVDFATFVGVFVVSQVIGVYTPVPGALGVFEGLFMFLLPEAEGNEVAVFAALIAYRIIYFLIPLMITGGIMTGMSIASKMRTRKGLV